MTTPPRLQLTGIRKAYPGVLANDDVDLTVGQGEIHADIKSFRVPSPSQPGSHIWYACPEGPEAAAYLRGTGSLVDGSARNDRSTNAAGYGEQSLFSDRGWRRREPSAPGPGRSCSTSAR